MVNEVWSKSESALEIGQRRVDIQGVSNRSRAPVADIIGFQTARVEKRSWSRDGQETVKGVSSKSALEGGQRRVDLEGFPKCTRTLGANIVALQAADTKYIFAIHSMLHKHEMLEKIAAI